MKKILLKGLIAMIIISLLVACGAGESEKALSSGDGEGKQTLKLATSADFPPFESRDPEGNFEGFDIELAEMIAEKLGYELDIEDMSFDGLIGSLQSNRVDMVMAGMSATEERKENVDFSDEYHRSGEMFITKSSEELEDLDDLTGKVVGVQLGTIQEEGAEKLAEQYDFEVKKVDDAGLLIQELNSNRIDVGYMDKSVAVGYMDSQDLIGFDDPTKSSPGMGIAFPKGSDLVEPVNEVLQKFEEDGTIDKLTEKWITD